jgi:hypothetical protein
MLETVYGNEALPCKCIFKWFKIYREDVRALNMMQGMDSHELLKMQKFVYCWLETTDRPYN